METSTIYTQFTNKQLKALTNNINYITLKNFYQKTTIDNYYKSKEKLDDDTIKKYIEDYSLYYKTKYIDIYKNAKDNKKYLKSIEEIEKNLTIDNIKALREMGNDIINNIIEIGKIDKEIKDKKGFSILSSKKTGEIAKLKADRDLKIEEQKQLHAQHSTYSQFKSYLSGMFDNNDESKNKEERIQFKFKFIMKELILIIKEEKAIEIKKVFEIKFDLFECETLIKSLSQYIKLSLRDMEFRQFISKNKEYQKILFSKNKNDNYLNNIINNNEINLILIEFENNISFPISPFKFKLHFGKQMYIIVDYYYIYYLYDLFLKHISSIDLNNLTSMVNEKISSIVQIGYNNLLLNKEREEEENKNNDKLFNIHIDILLNAPILLFPLYFRDNENTELMYVSLGQLKIKSELAGEKDKNAIYDKYIVDVSNISIKTLEKFNNEDNMDEVGEKLLFPSSFYIDIEKYIYQKPKLEHKIQNDFSPVLINLVLNNIQFSINEEQIIFMIKYLENFQITKIEFEKEEAKKEKIKNKKKEEKIKEQNKEEEEKKEEKEQIKEEEIINKKVEENNVNKKDEDKIEDKKVEKKDEQKDEQKEEKKEEKKEEIIKSKEINNMIKVSMKLGIFKIFILKNLIVNEGQNQRINFLSFFFRESNISLIMKSNGSLNMDMLFGHFYLYDEDYKLDEYKNKISYINPEFKCIIGTTAFGIKDKKKEKIKFSEIYDFKNEDKLKESLRILLALDAEKKMTTVNIFMSKLTISPNLNTSSRIYLFLMKYLQLYNDSMNKIKYEIFKDNMGNEEIKRVNTIDSFAPPPINLKLDDNIQEKEKKNEIKEKNNGKSLKIKEYSVITVLFAMKGIDIYIPIESNSKNSSILFMSVEIPIKYTLETDAEIELNFSKIIRINYNIKKTQIIADINKGTFSIYEYKDDAILLNSINQIYDNIDLSFLMRTDINKGKKCNMIYIMAIMNKEMNISININHIIVFLDLFGKINNFFKELNKQEEIINKEKEEEIKLLDEEIDIKRARTEQLLKIREKNDEKFEIEKEENKKINITHFIDIFTYEFTIANISIKFYDIIDGLYQSLFEFYISDITIEMLQNSNPKDCTNLMTYLINSFTHERKELNTYDKNNFYLYFNVLTNVEVKSLNNYLNQWEYFIEPLSIKFYYCQFLKRMRPNIDLIIPDMLNINLSSNFAKILAFTLNKFSMNKKEIEKNKKEILLKNEDTPGTPNYFGIESPILIFENYTGVDMEIWFDNNKYEDAINNDLVIKIENNKKFQLTNNLLLKYKVEKEHNNLNSTISYKFCLDEDFIKNANINKKNIVGNYFNINYHHIDIHDINNLIKISIESCSDNLLCRHIFFNSLISIRNDTKFTDILLCNDDKSRIIELKDNKKKMIPISWILNNKNINIIHNNDCHILMKSLSQNNEINKYILFNNNDIILIDIIRYKINLDEYYSYRNPIVKNDIFRVDIVLSPPIKLINNTPYEFIVNDDNKIVSTKSLDIYNKNFRLLSDYIKIINEKGKKKRISEKQIIVKILKDINLQIIYENNILSATSLVEEKIENDDDDDKNEEGKAINNFSSYNKNLSVLLKDNNTKQYLICRLFFNNPYELISYNNKIYKTMKIELNSFKYEIVFDYYFVNRTNQNLFLNNKVIDGINKKKDNCSILANKYTPISKALLNKKVNLRYNNKHWSDKFEMSALGEEFTLNIKKDEINYYSFGAALRISHLFNKSIALIIEDKYIIINDLPFDINIKEDSLSTITRIKSKENKILLLNEDSLKKKNNYRVGINKCYSHKFDIDKLGFYDLLISYNEKIFIEQNIDTEDKLIELNNVKYYPIRCVINTINKNTIYILFSYNKEYINQFSNHTPYSIEIILNKDKKSKYLVKPEKTIPLIYINDKGRYEPFDLVKITFNDLTSEIVKLNKTSIRYAGKKRDYVIRIQPEKNNSIKCIKVYNKRDLRLKSENYIKHKIKKYTKVSGSNIKLYLFGIGFSIINEKPKEIFYLSLYDIYLCYKFSNVVNILNEYQDYNSLLFSLKNLQLDYCLDNAYDIVFNPTNQLLPPKSNEKKNKKEKNFLDKVLENEEDNTPFIQFVISQKINHAKINDVNKLIYSVFPEIALFIQEFDVRINTILINSLIKVINEYIQLFRPQENDNSELKSKKENNLNENEDENKINDANLIIDKNKDEHVKKSKDILLNKEGKITNLVIDNLTLSAIKSNTTFKVNKNAIEIKYVPEFLITLINTLCSTLSSFSDVTLKLKEISFSNVFSDFDSLYGKLMSYYKNQILAQIYKIILNIDLLGNPFNLLEGLGTGLFQLFNEPRKGLLKGPEEFGLGITRGARALVSNVVGGGFNSVSKITGTLLNATKNLSSIGTTEEIVIKEEEKPKGLISGALSGFKKGFGELTHGVAGIVTKPIEQSQKDGVGGFFKGLGSGIVGAVLAPVNTVLTVGNQVTSGISNSEFISNKKSIRRFRLPRTLYKYLPICPYNEKQEMERKRQREKVEGSKVIIISLSNEKLYLENSTEIVMIQKLSDLSNIIFTNVMIKIMNPECTRFIKKIYICDIKDKKEDNNNVEIILKDDKKINFSFKNERGKKFFVNGLNLYLN